MEDSARKENDMRYLIMAGMWAVCAAGVGAQDGKAGWSIGKADGNTREFALAPGNYAGYAEDPVYLVGTSDPARDWPYVHPGPADAWAGSRPHTFTVLFNLAAVPAAGQPRLVLRLADTHSRNLVQLEMALNDAKTTRDLPAGGGDDSVQGKPEAGKRLEVAWDLPLSALKAGGNELRLTTLRGSWLLYDAVALQLPDGSQLAPVTNYTRLAGLRAVRALVQKSGTVFQPVTADIVHGGAEGTAELVAGKQRQTVALKSGRQSVDLLLPPVTGAVPVTVQLLVAGLPEQARTVTLQPVRRVTIYIVPHSHTDIGYTALQTEIEQKQVNNLIQGIEIARRTEAYPEGARFVWNVEEAWAADLYLQRQGETGRQTLRQAVREGKVALTGMYLNELSGLCRPEELLRLYRYGTRLGAEYGVPVNTAMISDVPGHVWGNVPAMAQAGIKYLSTAPNYFDRIGNILVEWENKPFYWVGPDGQSQVLVWIPWWGYALSHRIRQLSDPLVAEFQAALDAKAYPYDIAYIRWAGHGDNAEPEPSICDFVRDWKARYAWPRFIISSQQEPFEALEKRHGAALPRVRGDWTPYWEDGAGSSALETGLNRASSDRVAQAETLWAMLDSASYPAAAFEAAWNRVLLYSEHTWGAWCSVTDPEHEQTRGQWKIKRSYAVQADAQSRDLLSRALALGRAGTAVAPGALEVLNTVSWPRSALVTLTAAEAAAGNDRVCDATGQPVPSQRLTDGALVFLAGGVPPLGAASFAVGAGAPSPAPAPATATAAGALLENDRVRVRLDERTGGIVELTAKAHGGNFADPASGHALNEYLYFNGSDPKTARSNGAVKIRVGEPGPLVASLVVESEAPGCKRLVREVRLRAGEEAVEVLNLVDKERLRAPNYKADNGKESLNFAYCFAVSNGLVRLDVPFGVVQAEEDQMPSACRNWLSLSRWADVSAAERGVTLVSLDAPLLQVGGLTANLLNSQTNPDVWRKRIDPSQRLFVWAMNNHWGTNYRAYQEGPTWFRFVLRPHGAFDPAEATRFAVGCSQPLLARPAGGGRAPLLEVTPAAVLVTGLKPADDGRGLIVRLQNVSAQAARAELRWQKPAPRSVTLSTLGERAGRRFEGGVDLPAWGVATVRAE